MKNKILIVLTLLCAAFALSACGGDPADPPSEHATVHHAEKPYTCTQDGHLEYWSCKDCDKIFADAKGTKEISLESVTLPAAAHRYGTDNICSVCHDVLYYTKGLSYELIPETDTYSVTGIGTATETEITIPPYYEEKLVTEIGGISLIRDPETGAVLGIYINSFPDTITKVTIPDSIVKIGYGAFSDCRKLTSVTIPNSVTSIESSAFNNCRNLTNVTIGNSVTSIGDFAFYSCYRLTSITIPNSVTSIGKEAFCACSKLTSVTIPNSVTSIGSSAFNNCSNLTNVTIGNSVTSIGDGAFCACSKLTSVKLENGQQQKILKAAIQ